MFRVLPLQPVVSLGTLVEKGSILRPAELDLPDAVVSVHRFGDPHPALVPVTRVDLLEGPAAAGPVVVEARATVVYLRPGPVTIKIEIGIRSRNRK